MSNFRTIASLSAKLQYHEKLLNSILNELENANFHPYANQRPDAHQNEKVLCTIQSMCQAGLSEDCQG